MQSKLNTKRNWLMLILLLMLHQTALAQTFTAKNLKFTLFSPTPIEDIRAASYNGLAVINGQTQEIALQIAIKSFEFDKKLMQVHFNENYMESDKFPLAKFKGIISPKIDWKKDGEYQVSAKGVLTIHGVDQNRVLNGKIIVKNKQLTLTSSFNVACADHQVKIPSLMFTKIAESIQVNAQGSLNQIN